MSFMKLPVLRHGLMSRHEDIFPDAAIAGRIERARKLMQKSKVKSLLVYSDAVTSGPVCYLTNYPCYGLGRRATVVLGLTEGPFLFTAEPSRNLPRVRLFTSCDLEKTRQFIPAGCKRAGELAGGGPIGMVNGSSVSVGFAKDMETKLAGLDVKDLSREYWALLSAKDQGSLKATRRAIEMAREGMNFIGEQLSTAKDLWQLAADVDYRLRILGCEDTNILLGCAKGRHHRPGYPTHIRPLPGEHILAIIGVQHARHWGLIGRTFALGQKNRALDDMLGTLKELQRRVAGEVRVGISMGKLRALFLDGGRELGLTLAQDLPPVTGLGFDPLEYPTSSEDILEDNMSLQVALAVDSEKGFTAMLVDMLIITPNGGVWISKES
ncbi:M24 family metallopeptidase [Thermodesulfobacteriota bacterium]